MLSSASLYPGVTWMIVACGNAAYMLKFATSSLHRVIYINTSHSIASGHQLE
jgi:hypothetical protein